MLNAATQPRIYDAHVFILRHSLLAGKWETQVDCCCHLWLSKQEAFKDGVLLLLLVIIVIVSVSAAPAAAGVGSCSCRRGEHAAAMGSTAAWPATRQRAWRLSCTERGISRGGGRPCGTTSVATTTAIAAPFAVAATFTVANTLPTYNS